MKRFIYSVISAVLALVLLVPYAYAAEAAQASPQVTYIPASCTEPAETAQPADTLGTPVTVIDDGYPDFCVRELTVVPYIAFSELDELGRCGPASACLGPETLAAEERGAIGNVKPSGWQLTRYDDIIDGRYLYNRCHLIGYQLCGINSDPTNLITGTRFFNNECMLPYESAVARYISDSGNHVLYRATPVYDGESLVAAGVILEGYSVEDLGNGICFRVYIKNIQPGVKIDYSDGSSEAVPGFDSSADTPPVSPLVISVVSAAAELRTAEVNPEQSVSPNMPELPEPDTSAEPEPTYILNTNTHKFHKPGCRSVADISDNNRSDFFGERDELISRGYSPCGRCRP